MRPRGSVNRDHGEKQERILQAAAGCFARFGFHQSSMKEICAAADMSPGSVYRYFPAKEDIVAAMIEADRRRWEQRFGQIPLENGFIAGLRFLADIGLQELEGDGFLNLWIETCAEAARNAKVAATMRQSYEIFESQLAELVRESQRLGRVNPSLEPTATARIILAAFDGLLLRRCFDPQLDVRATVQSFLTFLEAALSPQAAPRPSRRTS
ncbi:MAG: TetR/AcrR family transcriptional regulator [Verrucomicrobia bacterium]|nr:TetR/AcrR family transcriptional regulator [Verrucomicrobiota bacterium]